jgi:hypothetical protein
VNSTAMVTSEHESAHAPVRSNFTSALVLLVAISLHAVLAGVSLGRAVQADPTKPTLKAPGIKLFETEI